MTQEQSQSIINAIGNSLEFEKLLYTNRLNKEFTDTAEALWELKLEFPDCVITAQAETINCNFGSPNSSVEPITMVYNG